MTIYASAHIYLFIYSLTSCWLSLSSGSPYMHISLTAAPHVGQSVFPADTYAEK